LTTPPLPESPCVRCNVTGVDDAGNDWGIRFFLSYAGSAPTAANCATLASDIASAYTSELGPLMHPTMSLTGVDVLDIASDTGASGTWSGSDAGTATGNILPVQTAMNVQYEISRRYRGGKPRTYLPIGTYADIANQSQWDGSFVTSTNTAVAAFFSAIAALSVGALGAQAHVNVSFYQGFTNHTNTSGRERPVPTYRDVAIVDPITGYSAKLTMGSQKRRRTATHP
jgi:hypothetical protein